MAKATKQDIFNFIKQAQAMGLPADQVVNFAKGRYVPQPKQMEFHYWARQADHDTGPSWIGYGGARGPGKSHASFAQIALDDCQRVDDLKGLFLRSVGGAARESFEDLITKVLFASPYEYKATRGTVHFQNGSRILMGGFRDDSTIAKYIGIEYDFIVVEEATLLSNHKIDLLLGSLRTSKKNWRPRAYFTTNPGNVGHGAFKRRFIMPMRAGKEKQTKFIQANVYDNKFVDAGYLAYLEGLTGWMREAWLEGSWEIAAGTFFTNWDRKMHVIDNFVETGLPYGWDYWLAIDYGYNHWTVIYLLARGRSDGIFYLIDETVARFKLVPEIAADITSMLQKYGLSTHDLEGFYGSPDLTAVRGGYTRTSISDQFAEHGYKIQPAVTDRINGAAKMLQLFGNPSKGVPPTLFVTDLCTQFIECIPNLIHDPSRPEDVLKVDANSAGIGGDDPYEAARYGLMSYKGVSAEMGRAPMAGYRG